MITAEKLGIPQVLFDICQDKVITIKQVHKVTPFRTSSVVTNRLSHPIIPNRFITKQEVVEAIKLHYSQKNELFGVGLLNFITLRTREHYWLDEEKSTDTTFVFTNTYSGNEFIVIVKGDVVYLQDIIGDKTTKTYSIKKTDTKTKVVTYLTRDVTVEQLATEIGVSTELATNIINASEQGGAWVWEAGKIASDNHVAHAFASLSIDSNVVSGNFYINGKDFREFKPFGSLVFPFGKAGQDFCVDWVLYNEHTDETPDWYSEGNFGEGARVRIADKNDPRAFTVNVAETDGEPYYNADTHTFYYNPSKEALLAIQPTLLPAQGKNDDHECIIDIKTGKIYYSRFEAMAEAK